MGQQVGERALLREMQPLFAQHGAEVAVSMPKDAAKIEEAHLLGVLQAGEHLVILVYPAFRLRAPLTPGV